MTDIQRYRISRSISLVVNVFTAIFTGYVSWECSLYDGCLCFCLVLRPSLSGNIEKMFYAVQLFPLLLYCILASSCCGYVHWIYPNSLDHGLTFNYVDTVYFTWTSSIAEPWMNLWCAPNQTSPQSETYGKAHLIRWAAFLTN